MKPRLVEAFTGYIQSSCDTEVRWQAAPRHCARKQHSESETAQDAGAQSGPHLEHGQSALHFRNFSQTCWPWGKFQMSPVYFEKTDFLKVIYKIRLEVTPTIALDVCLWDSGDLIILSSLFSDLCADSSLVSSPALSLSPPSSSVTPTGRPWNVL